MPLGLPGLMVGRPLSPLSRAISSRWAATVRSNAVTRPNSSSTNRFRSAFDRPSRSGAGDMQGIESELSLRRNPDPAAQPGLLPMLRLIHGTPSGVSCASLTGSFDGLSGMSSPPPRLLLGG